MLLGFLVLFCSSLFVVSDIVIWFDIADGKKIQDDALTYLEPCDHVCKFIHIELGFGQML
jgi:hypothetical protein